MPSRSVGLVACIFSLSLLAIACSSGGRGSSTGIVAIERLRLRSSTAEAARIVGELKSGDRVSIIEQSDAEGVQWARVQGPDGSSGWVQMRSLIDQEAFDKSHLLESELKDIQTQATGRSKATLKLRLTPDRASEENVLNTLPSATELEILRRERNPRPAVATEAKDGEPASDQKYDEWYQVRVKTNDVTPAGWIYGGSIELQIPADIIYYPSSGKRIVGWQSLGEAKDEQGRSGGHFLVLERAIFGSDQDADFDRVKILAYDPAARDYSTPFREDIHGRFPIKLNLDG
ncbi:MAG: SH3 domain-containing protein, partial [Acidobacteriota bacterium]